MDLNSTPAWTDTLVVFHRDRLAEHLKSLIPDLAHASQTAVPIEIDSAVPVMVNELQDERPFHSHYISHARLPSRASTRGGERVRP